MKSLVIVADGSFVVETIRLALRNAAGLRTLGTLDGRASIADAVAEQGPDVVLVDEMQDPADTLDRIREARLEAPAASVVLLSLRMDDEWVAQAIDAGVDACLSKAADLPTVAVLIRAVADRNLIGATPTSSSEVTFSAEADDLTRREREILGFVAEGLTNAGIGRELWVTEQTVKFHLSNVYRKLGVSNRTEASRFAWANGLFRDSGPGLVAA